MKQFDDLLNRLKAARAPSRQLDREILRIVTGRIGWSCLFAPRYTRSFELALTLLPPLVFVEICAGTDTYGPGVWPAVSIRWLPPGTSDPKKWNGTVQGAPSFALAMCCAAIEVRSRIAGDA